LSSRSGEPQVLQKYMTADVCWCADFSFFHGKEIPSCDTILKLKTKFIEQATSSWLKKIEVAEKMHLSIDKVMIGDEIIKLRLSLNQH